MKESLDLIPHALNALSQSRCDNRDDWIRVGMAIHAATDGSEEGFNQWEQWSKKSERYKPGCTRTQWQSFKTGKGIGPGTLFHMADQDSPGWRDVKAGIRKSSPKKQTRKIRLSQAEKVAQNFGKLSADFASRIHGHDSHVQEFAHQLGVTTLSLQRLAMGMVNDAYSFPMQSEPGVICGVHKRYPDGRKEAVSGSRNGLFIPTNFEPEEGDLVVVCEGVSDTAAALSIGFMYAIGRPGCRGGVDLLKKILRNLKVLIVSDNDTPGMKGAQALRRAVLPVVNTVQLVNPPEGIKDLREWVQKGASQKDVLLRSTEPTSIGIIAKAAGF